ncbi:glycine cleavage system protein GcvH [Actinocatenispora rupis]|uniref:Glycine cleavage system H protein n=1 Tax=Actinocatenispora rupis TaxID=519421 RepID=A0A8J3J609_9ACTN|nr:glycine cleavage system protein GcvH [Actinocatenispora rupis]GID12587.1 glycine cleavage system H protein [Actinocatenispora rupis]
MIPDDLRYTAEHEWVRPSGGTVRVGITDFAQDSLGDIVFVELPEPGRTVTAGESVGELESTKSVSDLYAPVAGTVTARNEALSDAPDLVNRDPYGEGWMVEIELADPSVVAGLLDAAAYEKITSQG